MFRPWFVYSFILLTRSCCYHTFLSYSNNTLPHILVTYSLNQVSPHDQATNKNGSVFHPTISMVRTLEVSSSITNHLKVNQNIMLSPQPLPHTVQWRASPPAVNTQTLQSNNSASQSLCFGLFSGADPCKSKVWYVLHSLFLFVKNSVYNLFKYLYLTCFT